MGHIIAAAQQACQPAGYRVSGAEMTMPTEVGIDQAAQDAP